VRGAAAGGSRFASDAELGFQKSQAPALNPSINQWVSAPVVARYRQTATNAGIAPVRVAAVPPKGGAPEAMSGAVSSDFGGPVTTASASIAAMNGGITPTAVVYFPGDGTTLSKAARDQIRSAADQFKAAGAAGSVRVVGHASSRTPNMTVEKHLETIFKKSQDRANAVAQELIHQGVPAAKVLIDAVGDSQPVYYESMPRGEEGNRRAEIFVQG
jgi:outer membrane protein OmpA-like peptidoglycan-associated protein